MKVKLTADVGFVGCKQVDIVEVDESTTEQELNNMAREYFEEVMSPEYDVEILDESHNDHDCEQEECAYDES